MYHADPLVCRQCGGKLKVVAYVTGEVTVKLILAGLGLGLGLSPPEEEKPPPIREVVRVPVHDEGREIQATCLLRPPPPTPSGGTTGGNRSSMVALNRKYGNMGV